MLPPIKPRCLVPPPMRANGTVIASAVPIWPSGDWDIKKRALRDVADYHFDMVAYRAYLRSLRIPDLRNGFGCSGLTPERCGYDCG